MASDLLCPVTAVRFLSLHADSSPHLLSATGNLLRVHTLSGHLLASAPVLPAGARVHGIDPFTDTRVLVRGGRWLALVRVTVTPTACTLLVTARAQLPDWVFAATSLADGTAAAAVGHGQVLVLAGDDLACVRRARCDDAAVSWSAAVREGDDGVVDVAHARADGTILVWRMPEAGGDGERVRAARVRGHTGAAMSLAFAEKGGYLASASVDRSVRLWRRGTDGVFVPARSFFGHRARAWCVALLEDADGGEPTVVSSAEDRTCRAWMQSGGARVLRGHAGRNVWGVAVRAGSSPMVASGGEDGSVKLWALPAEGRAMRRFELPEGGGNPRKREGGTEESARAMIVVGGKLVVATDFGRVMAARREGDGIEWETLFRDPGGGAFVPNALVEAGGMVMAGMTDGTVVVLAENDRGCGQGWRFQGTGKEGRMVMGVFADVADEAVDVFVASPHAVFHWIIESVRPATARQRNEATAVFEEEHSAEGMRAVCVAEYRHDVVKKNMLATSVAYARRSRVVLVGDRGGRVTAYSAACEQEGDESLEAPPRIPPLASCRPHSDRVSTLEVLPTDGKETSGVCEILSASFDGRMARLHLQQREASLTIMSSLRSIEKVETLCKIQFPREAVTGQLAVDRPCLVAFRSTDIVLWDLHRRNELFRWQVGNWRRAYALDARLRLDGEQLAVERVSLWFWRAGRLFLVEGADGEGRETEGQVLSMGPTFHGQRVNDLEIIPHPRNVYAITAGEDTVLRVMRKGDAWETHQTLTQHISGVYAVAVAEVGGGRVVAVSGGGCDEVVVWAAEGAGGTWGVVGKVSGGATVGRVMNGGRTQREKEAAGAKHRVMSVACLPQLGGVSKEDCVMAVVGRSDCSVGLMRWSQRSDASLVSSCEFLAREVQNRGAVLSLSVTKMSEHSWAVFSGDSGGYVCMWQIAIEAEESSWTLSIMHRWRAHEGGVLSVSSLPHEGQIVGATGGDCGHVGVFQTHDGSVVTSTKLVSCSAVSGVQMMLVSDAGAARLAVLATGGAQSVISLQVHMPISPPYVAFSAERVHGLSTTGIVDASVLKLVASSARGVEAIVGGHGLEHLRLAW